MTRPNRGLPTQEIVAHPARGDFMGNRGQLHDDRGRLTGRAHTTRCWVCCTLSFRGRERQVMAPGQYTELFFLDEAVALAAGHRPCAECRRADYNRWREAWGAAFGEVVPAAEMDRVMHAARIVPRRGQLRHEAPAATLPDGAFVLLDEVPHLVLGDRTLPYAPDGYTTPVPRPAGAVTVLTPAPTLRVLAAGFRPALHRSASAFAS
ncbi:hypothetical protein E0K89_008780 [Aquicoccus sp. SCR17]|nr:hypothetical protein [Carideicomes alvinocaridis]